MLDRTRSIVAYNVTKAYYTNEALFDHYEGYYPGLISSLIGGRYYRLCVDADGTNPSGFYGDTGLKIYHSAGMEVVLEPPSASIP